MIDALLRNNGQLGLVGRLARASVALAVALGVLQGCVPASSVKLEISRRNHDPIQFRNSLVQVATRNGFVADAYSDVIQGESPFRRLGDAIGATFSFPGSSRISVQLSINSENSKASFWIVEAGSEKLSRATARIAES